MKVIKYNNGLRKGTDKKVRPFEVLKSVKFPHPLLSLLSARLQAEILEDLEGLV